MASTATVSSGGGGRRRRVLSPSEKYEIYVAVLTGQCTQREAAEKWRVDRTTVTTICRLAKAGALEALSARPGRPGKCRPSRSSWKRLVPRPNGCVPRWPSRP
jgi:transposase